MADAAVRSVLVGEGGYGKVEEVTVNGEKCAKKSFHEALLTEQTKTRVTEIKNLKKLRYACLLSILEVSLDPSPQLVMELMPLSLREALREGIEAQWRNSILLDVASALHFLHGGQTPMFHGDLHSGNVLLTADLRAKLSDYAQVYIVGKNPVEVVRERQTGHHCLLYMPPEAFSEPPARVGAKFDVFSFGVVMLETLAEQPWEVSITSVEFQWPAGGEQRTSSLQAVPDSHPLKTMAEQCLSLKCGDRPSVEELRKTLCCVDQPVERKEERSTSVPWERRSCSPGPGHREEGNGEEKDQENVREEKCRRKEDGEVEEKEEKEEEEEEEEEQQHGMTNGGKKGEETESEGGREAESKKGGVEEEEGTEGESHDSTDHPKGGGEDKEDFVFVSSASPGQSRPHSLFEQGSMVEVKGYGFGVVQWVGELRGKKMAGIELEEYKKGCGNGTPPGSKAHLFSCPPGHGLFSPVSDLSPDRRFQIQEPVNPLKDVPLETVEQKAHVPHQERYCGKDGQPVMRGIQGEHNSCYLDATLFGLFALSSEFDQLLTEDPAGRPEGEVERDIRDILWTRIINPLRKNGVVRYEPVLELRSKLEQLGRLKGLVQEEKDPEEFLNMLFKHALQTSPFITIQRPQGEEGEFFVQLFMEPDKTLKQPTIGELLRKMFREQHITFSKVPQKLLIQVPRYGKQFKTFQQIIPDKELDIEGLCTESALQPYRRYAAKPEVGGAEVKDSQAGELKPRLQLLSVICIETSHYVCFTRASGDRWLLMDSMADRVDDTYNIPKCRDCTDELRKHVYRKDPSKKLAKNLPELARRFTQDIYMCVYTEDSTFV